MLNYFLTLKGPHEGGSGLGNIRLVEYMMTPIPDMWKWCAWLKVHEMKTYFGGYVHVSHPKLLYIFFGLVWRSLIDVER